MSGMRDSLAAFIRWVMRDTAYHRVFTAVVMAPSDGATVDLLPDDPTVAGNGLQGVPVSYGVPGASAKLLPGIRMLLIFEGGDPSKPRAICFDGSPLEVSFGGGQSPVARVGDNVTINPLGLISGGPGSPVTGSCIGTIMAGAVGVKA
jgi:hypothetical protein